MTADIETSGPQGHPRYKYRAFISYSRHDMKFARRLHAALETYKIPHLSGNESEYKHHLGRIFRDDDEMAATSDIGDSMRRAIEDAECMIVVCSPHAANSHWVNLEIEHFRKTGRGNRVFAVIIDGKPNSSDITKECFPPAFRVDTTSLDSLSELALEPLALDARSESFSRLRVRLAAGIMNIPFDSLWRRESRRNRNQTIVRIAAISLIGIFASAFYLSNEIVRWWNQAAISSRLIPANESIELSADSKLRLKEIIASSELILTTSFKDGLNQLEEAGADGGDMWGMSQIAAVLPFNSDLFTRFEESSLNTLDNSCGCWKFNNRGLVPISFWAFEAYSEAGLQAPVEAIDAIIELQSQNGSWPAQFGQVQTKQSSSVYVTALVLIALKNQRNVLQDNKLISRIDAAIDNGDIWLLSVAPDEGELWADYPISNRAVEHSLFGGMAISALSQSSSKDEFSHLAGSWISEFELASPSNYISSDTPLEFMDGTVSADLYRHIPFTWNLMGALVVWPVASDSERIDIIYSIENALIMLSNDPKSLDRDWVRADVLYALKKLDNMVH